MNKHACLNITDEFNRIADSIFPMDAVGIKTEDGGYVSSLTEAQYHIGQQIRRHAEAMERIADAMERIATSMEAKQ